MAEDFNSTGVNGDEASNRTFLIAAVVLGAVFIVGVIAVVIIASSRSNGRQAQQAVDQAATATADAVALVTPTEPPTSTPEPTDTPEPTETPAPTQAPETPTEAATAETAEATPAGTVSASSVTGVAPTPSAARTPTAAAQSGVAGAQGTPGATGTLTAGKGSDKIPDTGVGDVAGLALAGTLIVLLVVARRLRMAQS